MSKSQYSNPNLMRMSQPQQEHIQYNQRPLSKIIQQQQYSSSSKQRQQPQLQQQQQRKQNTIQQQQQQQQNSDQVQPKQQSCWSLQNIKTYSYSWIIFISAFTIYVLIWLIGHFSIQRLTSYYYFNQFNISPYANIEYWKLSQRANNLTVEVYIKSNTLYEKGQLERGDSMTLELVFSWVMWKLPLTIFTLSVIINHNQHYLLRYSTWCCYLLLLLLIDIMPTVFRPQGYQDWIYFIIYFALSLILVIVNGLVGVVGGERTVVNNIKNYLLPIAYIALAYACYTTLIPAIYHTIYSSDIHQDAPYLIVHIYPVIDFISYILIILITYYCDHHVVKFIKMLYFLNMGYAIGNVILFSPDDVEFYYLCVYFVIRNFSLHWILQRVQKFVIVPGSLPGWIMIYLVSLAVNFVPLTGIGRLVVSKSFYSQILQLTLPILSYKLPDEYFAYYANKLPSISTFNPSLHTNIQISSVFIIWVLISITQKYHISKIQRKQIFFYIFAIYMFYFGITTGTQLYYLQANSL